MSQLTTTEFVQHRIAELTEKYNQLGLMLITGGASSYEHYRNIVGQAEGIIHSINVLEEGIKANDDDRDD